MAKKILMSGNEACGEGAILAGCKFYAGYPITPQNELIEYMAKRLPQAGGVFIQSESELAAINMVFGASVTGARAMTSSSSPGISLKQEGISYLAACELPAVIVNIMRGGPGLGNIAPAQGDYFQATRGGGHGDYHSIVLAPSTVLEMMDLTTLAFDLADTYRTPAIVLGDGLLGQMMEPITVLRSAYSVLRKDVRNTQCSIRNTKPWALTGCKGRKPRLIRSLLLGDGQLEALNDKLQAKYRTIQKSEVRCELFQAAGAEILLVGYGSVGRMLKAIVSQLRKKGVKIGLVRPITLWPFPQSELYNVSKGAKRILVVEMSAGQMLEDVKLAVADKDIVEFYGRTGGGIPSEDEIISKLKVQSAKRKVKI